MWTYIKGASYHISGTTSSIIRSINYAFENMAVDGLTKIASKTWRSLASTSNSNYTSSENLACTNIEW